MLVRWISVFLFEEECGSVRVMIIILAAGAFISLVFWTSVAKLLGK